MRSLPHNSLCDNIVLLRLRFLTPKSLRCYKGRLLEKAEEAVSRAMSAFTSCSLSPFGYLIPYTGKWFEMLYSKGWHSYLCKIWPLNWFSFYNVWLTYRFICNSCISLCGFPGREAILCKMWASGSMVSMPHICKQKRQAHIWSIRIQFMR